MAIFLDEKREEEETKSSKPSRSLLPSASKTFRSASPVMLCPFISSSFLSSRPLSLLI